MVMSTPAGRLSFFQFIHGLGRRVENINQPFVRALFESFLRFFVAMRRALDGEALDTGRERDGPATRAPVRLTVSAISRADWSMTRWS